MQLSKYIQFWKSLVRGDRIIDGHFRSMLEIDYAKLKPQHDLVIFDYDDTLTCLHGELSQDVIAKLKEIQSFGFKIGVVSNTIFSRYEMLSKMFEVYDIYIAPHRNKPSPEGFLNVSKHYSISLDRAVSIGDRLGTECYGSKLAGVKTIYLLDKYSKSFNCKHSFMPLNLIDKLERKIYFNKQSVN